MGNLIFLSVFTLSMTAFAKPPFLNFLKAAIPQAKNVSCKTCHGGTSELLNPFGRDFLKLVVNANMSKEGFGQLMELDSDGDTVKNYVELLQGTEPGFTGK